jgi:hypothetical protein
MTVYCFGGKFALTKILKKTTKLKSNETRGHVACMEKVNA